MPLPLVPIMLGAMAAGAGANLYSQYKQRQLYEYQKGGYERALNDYNKRNPTRPIRYPELSYPGHIRALDTGISQSYAASVGSVSRLAGQYTGNALYYRNARSRALYSQSTGRSSRYL